jgi:PAT family beta-lactamase induction signal transducer AmpG
LPPTQPDPARGFIGRLRPLYAEPRLLAVMLMGFASGLPLALTGATLSLWLAESKVSLASIGFFSLATLSYNLKFLWAPVLDRGRVPILTRLLGRRRSWALVIQAGLIVSILGLGSTDPAHALVTTAAWAVAVAFWSATQDSVIDAYRVELLTESEQGAGAAATQLGYRLGMLASGAGAYLTANAWGWQGAYAVMAALMLIGVATILLTPEPNIIPAPATTKRGLADLMEPIGEFMTRRDWLAILAFTALYSLGDATAAHLSTPFYVQLGFTKIELAEISKVFGVGATLVGISVGGIVVYRLGIMRALLVIGIAKMAANLTYLAQYQAGHSLPMLTMTVGVENLVMGMAGSAFIAYLSKLCTSAYTATQYALLSALATLARTTLSSWSGVFAQVFGWTPFFLLSVALALPGLALLLWLMRRPDDQRFPSLDEPPAPEGHKGPILEGPSR